MKAGGCLGSCNFPCKTGSIPQNRSKTSSLARGKREFGTRFCSVRNAKGKEIGQFLLLGSQEGVEEMRRSR